MSIIRIVAAAGAAGAAVALIATAPVADVGPAEPVADVARGEVLFELCTQCHGAVGAGDRDALAPAIAGLDPWYVEAQLRAFRAGTRGYHPDDVAGLRMRPMARTLGAYVEGDPETDIASVAAYVAQLPKTNPPPSEDLAGGDPAAGKAKYETVCMNCHGDDAAGREVLKAPSLNHANDWYLAESLRKYKAGFRGAPPDVGLSIAMRAMAMQLQDEQAIKDVIAYIQTLR